MNTFEFGLNSSVVIEISGETGNVIARAEYVEGPNQFLVEYRAADGCARSEWFSARQLA